MDLENNILVKAKKINKTQFTYECPFCWKISSGKIVESPFNKKTKRLYTTAKPGVHYHGSGGDLSNRIEHRITHCLINNEKDVYIEIDDNTKRC